MVGLCTMAMPVVAVARAAADSTSAPALGFFDVTAEATGIGGSVGDPTAQPYPTAAGLVPNSVAEIQPGPSGHALSSVAWPGPLAGNAGSLVNVIGTPLPSDVVANGNDPVKAEAAASGGGRDDQTLGPMSASVDGGTVVAKAAFADFAAPGAVSAARVATTSRTALAGSKLVAIADSELHGVEVAGTLRIDTIHTTAQGTTDGSSATTEPTVVVSGVTVAGQAATLDDKGLHLVGSNQPSPLDGAVSAANQALSAMKMTAYVTKPLQQDTSAGSASLDTGAVIVQWDAGGGQLFTAVLGGASVILRATAGDALGGAGALALPSAPPSGSAALTAMPALQSPGAPTVPLPSGSDTAGPPGGFAVSAPGGRRAPAKLAGPLDLTPAASFPDRPPFGWVLVGILGAAMFGSGLHRMRDRAVAAAGTASTCPLERGSRG
jgi:hypothetical protein